MVSEERQPQDSIDVAADEWMDTEDASILLTLYHYGRALSGQGPGSAERLCQEVAQLTQGRARLTLHPFEDDTPAAPAVSPAISSVVFAFCMALPVHHVGIAYGMLAVAHDSTQPMGLALPFAFCMELAAACGWLLHTLEETALIQTRSRQLTLSDPGGIGTLSPAA